MNEETQNIRDCWICEVCGRFDYFKFYEHAKRVSEANFCTGKVRRYKTWIKGLEAKLQKK